MTSLVHKHAYLDKSPQCASNVFLAPGVCIFGEVILEEGVSLWCNTVVRGDVNSVRIGKDTNIQDLCVLHVTAESPLSIGNNVTVGHRVILHGCTVGDRCLIGMGAIVLDNAKIGAECLIAAGSLVTQGSEIPPGSLVMGTPGKVKRALTPEERKRLPEGAEHYRLYAEGYLKSYDWPKELR